MTIVNAQAEQLRREGSGYSRHLGIRYLSVADGECRAEIDMAAHLENVVGGFHGGAAFSLIDCAMGAAVYSLLGPHERAATIEAKTNYLRPVREGRIDCHARVIHRGRSTAVLEADVTANGILIAKATGTFALIQVSPETT